VAITLDDIGGQWSLRFYTGELPVDEAVTEAGHEPNGYFWEGIVQFAWPQVADELELDSEAGMFAAYGERGDLEALRDALAPVLEDEAAVRDLIERAEADGFELDD
jgi:hypothetical protein